MRTYLTSKRAELQARKDESGFTLIELIVVILIMGIVTAMAAGVFSSIQKQSGGESSSAGGIMLLILGGLVVLSVMGSVAFAIVKFKAKTGAIRGKHR